MRAGHVTAKAAPIMRLNYGTVAKLVPIFKKKRTPINENI
jgi:hypothetical protein